MEYSSFIFWQVEPPHYIEVPHHVIATFSPWPMGPFSLVVVFPTILYQGSIQSLESHHAIVEGDAKDGGLFPFDNSRRYSATQSPVEDGIPRSLLWHYHK